MAKFNVYQNGEKIDTVTYADFFSAEMVQRDLNSRCEYGDDVQVFRKVKNETVGPNIVSVLKKAKQVLFTDSEYFNKDITGVKNLADIKSMFQIQRNGKLVKNYISGNQIGYHLQDSMYDFVLTIIE